MRTLLSLLTGLISEVGGNFSCDLRITETSSRILWQFYLQPLKMKQINWQKFITGRKGGL